MTRAERWLVWGSTATVAATGIAYAFIKYLVPPPDEWAVVNHPLQPWILKLHILAAPVLVFALGMLAARHVLPQLRVRRAARRRTGLAAALVVVPLVLSGYLLQTVMHSPTMRILGYVHLSLGTSFAVAALGHAIAARRRRAARSETPLHRPGAAGHRPTLERAS